MPSSRTMLILISAAFIVAVLAVMIYSTMSLPRYSVESCITYNGRTACGTAAGPAREEALRAAATVACSSIAGGMTQSIACGNTEPDSIRWIEE